MLDEWCFCGGTLRHPPALRQIDWRAPLSTTKSRRVCARSRQAEQSAAIRRLRVPGSADDVIPAVPGNVGEFLGRVAEEKFESITIVEAEVPAGSREEERHGGQDPRQGEKGGLDAGRPVQPPESRRQEATELPIIVPPGQSSGMPSPTYRRLLINLELEIYRSRSLMKKGRMAEAEALLRRAVTDWPDDGRPYVVLGRLLQKLGRTGAARSVYEQGCQALGGDNAYVWQSWAVLEARLGNVARARKLFDAATAADEGHAAAWHGWAMLELREGNAWKARQLLQRGAKCCGDNAYIYQSLAVLEMRSGRLADARALFLRATQLSPQSAACWLAWALLEAGEGDTASARLLFEKALDASPKNRYAWQAWGVFEASQGRLALARKLLRRGNQLNPGDAVLLQAMALLEYECGFTGSARALFQEASEADPNHQPVWTAWGWMEWKEARLDAARRLFQQSIDVDNAGPSAARALQAWAVLEEREGNAGVARALFRRALQVDPNNDVVWKSWASMEERLGNAVRADELRSLRQQQRMEVVEQSWDLSSVITPAIDTLKSLLIRMAESPSAAARRGQPQPCPPPPDAASPLADLCPTEDDFDIDAFLARKIPRTFQRIVQEEAARERSVWRRPLSAREKAKLGVLDASKTSVA